MTKKLYISLEEAPEELFNKIAKQILKDKKQLYVHKTDKNFIVHVVERKINGVRISTRKGRASFLSYNDFLTNFEEL